MTITEQLASIHAAQSLGLDEAIADLVRTHLADACTTLVVRRYEVPWEAYEMEDGDTDASPCVDDASRALYAFDIHQFEDVRDLARLLRRDCYDEASSAPLRGHFGLGSWLTRREPDPFSNGWTETSLHFLALIDAKGASVDDLRAKPFLSALAALAIH